MRIERANPLKRLGLLLSHLSSKQPGPRKGPIRSAVLADDPIPRDCAASNLELRRKNQPWLAIVTLVTVPTHSGLVIEVNLQNLVALTKGKPLHLDRGGVVDL